MSNEQEIKIENKIDLNIDKKEQLKHEIADIDPEPYKEIEVIEINGKKENNIELISSEKEHGTPDIEVNKEPAQIQEPAQEEAFEKYRSEKLTKSLIKQYHIVETDYYRRDQSHKLAFSDKGNKLVHPEKETNERTVKAMMDLAEAKGWKQINISGTEEFKRDVWIEAKARGIEAKGYEPKNIDMARARELKKIHDESIQKEMRAHKERVELIEKAKSVAASLIKEGVKEIQDPKKREEVSQGLNEKINNMIEKADKIPQFEVYDKKAPTKMTDAEYHEMKEHHVREQMRKENLTHDLRIDR